MPMTPESKRALSTTIRGLRAHLLTELHAVTEATYRLSITEAAAADLDEATLTHRTRLEAWIAEQRRSQTAAAAAAGKATAKSKTTHRSAEDFRREAEKQAAYTLLNRLVLLRLLEAPAPTADERRSAPLRPVAVLKGGWSSPGYQAFAEIAPAVCQDDETEGYGLLLQLVFEDLATDLPGLYGPAGVADLIPIPAATLRHVVDALNAEALLPCWTDNMTLGWVYQYWNDPEREAIDAKLNAGGKVEPHEIASKTQMFTERYMVDWLLQNSLGPLWLAMCAKHGWQADFTGSQPGEAPAPGSTQAILEARRVAWRAKREAGEVALTALMPLHTELERRWAYTLPQPIPAEAVRTAPATIRDVKILDPAVGSGHFLVVAMGLLVALYREEARHRGEVDAAKWQDRAIVERILSHNLHGIDLDPRAVQIAAAALWLEARRVAPDAQPSKINLVAANLRLSSLPDDDPALVELRREVQAETGVPGELTDTVIRALRGADHLGSLLKIDAAVDEAIARMVGRLGRALPMQGDLLRGFATEQLRLEMSPAAAKQELLSKIEGFLAKHTRSDDLGLRLRGEQLAAGVRLVRLLKEGSYDLVVANPPYQGTAKMREAKYIQGRYPLGKADLYAAFLLRGLELVRVGGVSAMLTMRNWMFIKQYAGLRERLLDDFTLRALGDFETGAFQEISGVVVSVAASVFMRTAERDGSAMALKLTASGEDIVSARTAQKRAATLCHVGRHDFDPAALKVVPEWPLVYWWKSEMLGWFINYPLLNQISPIIKGMSTQDNTRFLRVPYEVQQTSLFLSKNSEIYWPTSVWVPYIKGGAGATWIESSSFITRWERRAVELRTWLEFYVESKPGGFFKNPEYYFRLGCAVTAIGSKFSARLHRYSSVVGHMGTSVYPEDPAHTVCLLNMSSTKLMIESMNPTVHFGVGDLGRIPQRKVSLTTAIVVTLNAAFTTHESHREPSVEFTHPGPSPWRHAQNWAQLAVDRPDGAPLPAYIEQLDPEPATDHLSFALGVALGRFGPARQGILDPATADLSHALPGGLLFLDNSLGERVDLASDDNNSGDNNSGDNNSGDSLGHSAAAPLRAAWLAHGEGIETKRKGLRGWLSVDFFKDVHRGMYDSRPIHWPLSSAKKTFVAWVNIHRFDADTLRLLLADHLHPTLNRLDGELSDLRAARDGADKKAAKSAEKRLQQVQKARQELADFIRATSDCADKGPPPTDAACPPRQRDARYDPDLDDGVMINSAALWPLLQPQWGTAACPKKWWKELATAKGRKDYDWSHLAMRCWPARVDGKCRVDPSLGVAHGCFWRYHPARAWAWELRLQDEIGPAFRIEEAAYGPAGLVLGGEAGAGDGDGEPVDTGDVAHRAAWLRDHPLVALTGVDADGVGKLGGVEKEALRRMGRGAKKQVVAELRILEAGLWSVLPAEVWAMETRLMEKQEAAFRLVAPDEAVARAGFEAGNPGLVQARVEMVKGFVERRQGELL